MKLTKTQVERQDFVDNSIYNLFCEILGFRMEWNIEDIGAVRDVIIDIGVKRFNFDAGDLYPEFSE